MFVALAITLIILSLMAHELGHAWAMHSVGVKFTEIGLGIPVAHVPHLRFTLKRKGGQPLAICLHPLLLGAYVKMPDEELPHIESMPYKDQSFIFGAGVLANLIFTGVMLMTADLFFLNAPISKMIFHWHFLLVAGITFLLIVGRKFFCRYLVFAIGIAMVALVIWSMTKDPLKSIAGPVGIVKMVSHFSVSIGMAINMAAIVSLALATCNALPLVPLDGGQIVQCLLRKAKVSENVMRIYRTASFFIFIALIATVLSIDFINILK